MTRYHNAAAELHVTHPCSMTCQVGRETGHPTITGTPWPEMILQDYTPTGEMK